MYKYITESTERQKREEEMLKQFIESTVSSLKAHDVWNKNLELKIEQCTNAIKEYFKKKNVITNENAVQTIKETKVTCMGNMKQWPGATGFQGGNIR